MSYVVAFDSYKGMFESLFTDNVYLGTYFKWRTFFFLWTEFFEFVLVSITLFAVSPVVSDKAYKLLRNLFTVALFYSSYFIYYFFNEAVFGQTFGKVLTNSVVAGQGRPLSRGRLVMRSLFRYIPVDAFTDPVVEEETTQKPACYPVEYSDNLPFTQKFCNWLNENASYTQEGYFYRAPLL